MKAILAEAEKELGIELNEDNQGVMDAERNGRRLSTPRDVPPAARKRVTTSAAGVSQA